MGRFIDYIILAAVIAGTACTAGTPDGQHETAVGTATVIEQTAKSSEEEQYSLTDEEISLIALVTMAEAEGESEYVKRLVIDTVLNRADSEHFPDSVNDVIYQPHQFTVMWNGRAERCEATNELITLVKEELENRTDSSVIFFRLSRYSDYGVPLFKEGDIYFSSYE
ncbi:MAG: cell wall hydrolase [Ruminococcus sp.]|nr:cell wall hydrolase [Ruminococcus sp.]